MTGVLCIIYFDDTLQIKSSMYFLRFWQVFAYSTNTVSLFYPKLSRLGHLLLRPNRECCAFFQTKLIPESVTKNRTVGKLTGLISFVSNRVEPAYNPTSRARAQLITIINYNSSLQILENIDILYYWNFLKVLQYISLEFIFIKKIIYFS